MEILFMVFNDFCFILYTSINPFPFTREYAKITKIYFLLCDQDSIQETCSFWTDSESLLSQFFEKTS